MSSARGAPLTSRPGSADYSGSSSGSGDSDEDGATLSDGSVGRSNSCRKGITASVITVVVTAVICVVAKSALTSDGEVVVTPMKKVSRTKLKRMDSVQLPFGLQPGERWGSEPTVRKLQSCDNVERCGLHPNSCNKRRRVCWEAVNKAMTAGDEHLSQYDVYRDDPRFGNNHAWYLQRNSDKLDFDHFQMMIHLHGGLNGSYNDTSLNGTICPKPCWTGNVDSKQFVVNQSWTAGSTVINYSKSLCPPQFTKYVPPPEHALAHNGITWPEMCFEGDRDEHVLLIGDWGGTLPGLPASNIMQALEGHKDSRQWVNGVDDQAQFLIAESFAKHAKVVDPRYILNVGDNFYWGGCEEMCFGRNGSASIESFYHKNNDPKSRNKCSHQFYNIFETMYMGPGLDGKPWLSVLGNHDYGGHQYHSAWDMQIMYTWGPSGRWVMPGLYWHQHVKYPTKDFTVDYFFLDTNIADTTDPWVSPGHNICSNRHNTGQSCAPLGMHSPPECEAWFHKLWVEQMQWLDKKLDASTADWQIIVTHFPPETCVFHPEIAMDLRNFGFKYGIDFVISGHRHGQELHPSGYGARCPGQTAGIPYIITGGGGGITSEAAAEMSYGFMDMTLTKDVLTIVDYTHTKTERGRMEVHKRGRR